MRSKAHRNPSLLPGGLEAASPWRGGNRGSLGHCETSQQILSQPVLGQGTVLAPRDDGKAEDPGEGLEAPSGGQSWKHHLQCLQRCRRWPDSPACLPSPLPPLSPGTFKGSLERGEPGQARQYQNSSRQGARGWVGPCVVGGQQSLVLAGFAPSLCWLAWLAGEHKTSRSNSLPLRQRSEEVAFPGGTSELPRATLRAKPLLRTVTPSKHSQAS